MHIHGEESRKLVHADCGPMLIHSGSGPAAIAGQEQHEPHSRAVPEGGAMVFNKSHSQTERVQGTTAVR